MKLFARLSLFAVLLSSCAPAAQDPQGSQGPIESSSHAIVSGGSFGLSGFGTNYTCNGKSCICDGPGGTHGDWDCLDMASNGECEAPLICSETRGHSICICREIRPMDPNWCKFHPQDCGVAGWFLFPGIYKTSTSPAVYKRLDHGDRTCYLTNDMWNYIGSPAPTVVSGDEAGYLMATYSGQNCTGEEAGWTHQKANFPDGLYRNPNTGGIYRLEDNRACLLSWTQWHDMMGSPAYQTLVTWGTPDTLQFHAGFDTNQNCLDMEIWGQ